MLTVVIETHNDEEGLARTLSSLVPGSVEGVIREVIVHDRGSTDHTTTVADHAGCRLVRDGDLASALQRAKGDWLLLLEPGARLVEGWTEAAIMHMTDVAGPARFTRSRFHRMTLMGRLFCTARPLAEGLLIARRQATDLLGGPNLGSLRRVRARRLAAEIVPSPKRA